MKTNTRARIVAIIESHGSRSPSELVKALGITPQAVHRHLRALIDAGTLEIQGRGPKTRYLMAGAPQLAGPKDWYCSRVQPGAGPSEFICETRDVFAARQSRMSSLMKAGLSQSDLPLVLALAGEIGNNCFDHNLGQWRDLPGCWLETQVTGSRLWICIADRGQGVLRSLARTQPGLSDEQAALSLAFERNVSGRAPEKRGNGLKFVRNIIAQGEGRGLACRSGDALVEYGKLGSRCARELSSWLPNGGGTAALILWSLR